MLASFNATLEPGVSICDDRDAFLGYQSYVACFIGVVSLLKVGVSHMRRSNLGSVAF